MNQYREPLPPAPLSVPDQLRCREVLSRRRRCTCAGACDCHAIETLLRLAADGYGLIPKQVVVLSQILGGDK